MSADKRKVSTDALETLGKLIGPDEKRDAIHLAVLPAVAGERLYRADRIDLVDGKAVANQFGLGIVDPFIEETYVDVGQYFWMVLKPRIITSLRHVWTHPDFPAPEDDATEQYKHDKEQKERARTLLENIASKCDIDPDEMIAGAHAHLDSGEYLNEGGRWEGIYTPEEFWPVFEILTGRKVPEAERENFFSCAC